MLFLLVWAWLASPAGAARPLTPPAPEFPAQQVWLNSEALTLKKLRKKRVVLVAFINTASLNSIRTFHVLNGWWQRYALKGLMVVGVHTPDFDFDQDPASVRRAIKRFGLSFPVVIDNDRAIWRGYANEGWPAMYLLDHKGRIVHDRVGEGRYREFELEIRSAMERFNRFYAPENLKPVEDPPSADCKNATPSVYLGSRRGAPQDLNRVRERGRELLTSREGETAYKGKWEVEAEGLRLSRDNPSLGAFARVLYRGAEANLLAGRARPGKVYLKQDDLWLHSGNAGSDIQWDEQDRSFITVSETRLHYLLKNDNDEMHELLILPESENTKLYGLEFSNSCQTDYLHK